MSKKLCLQCRTCFNLTSNDEQDSNYKCPECGNQALVITHRFRPPRKLDDKRWEIVAYLITNGFHYQHIPKYEKDRHGIQRLIGYVKYPENMTDAVEFVKEHSTQTH